MLVKFGQETDTLEAEYSTRVEYRTGYAFLGAINGHRPGKVHLYLGTTGGGKSTLIRSILKELVEYSMDLEDIMVWLSEEDVDDLRIEMSRCKTKENFNKVHVFSEQDCKDEWSAAELFASSLAKIEPAILIFDNLTTSIFYMDKRPHEQGAFASQLKKIARDKNIPILAVAHTKAEICENYSKIINSQDIRGTKSIVNMAQFIYIMQRFKVGEEYYPTIRLEKARGFSIKNSMFGLVYEHEQHIYQGDYIINFEQFKELFSKRNRLSTTSS